MSDPYVRLKALRKLSTDEYTKKALESERAKVSLLLGTEVSLVTTRKLRDLFMSSAQSAKSKSGKSFEDDVSTVLTENGVAHHRQVHDGIQGDFIIPTDGRYIILSTKTVLRERWREFIEEKRDQVSVYVLTLDKITTAIRSSLNSHGILIIQENLTFKEFINLIKGHDMNIIDLFCGAGGMSVGFEKAGFTSLLGLDNNIKALETYSANRPESAVVCDNIKTISANSLEEKIGSKPVNLIVGGPPCTAFSMAGKRDPNDIRASLFMDFVRMVNHFKPQVAVMENVAGILTARTVEGELVLNLIISEYDAIGYKVYYKKLNSASYGVPQKRIRVIFVCVRSDISKEYEFPEPTVKEFVQVKTILEPEVDPKYTLSAKMVEGFEKRKGANKASGKGFGFQVLDPDLPSYTISARYYKDGADALVQLGPSSYRKLTELEVARIQTFPDDYKFAGTSSEVYTQIGNAVPCLLAEVIARSIKEFLKDVPLTYRVSKEVDKVEYNLEYSALLAYNKTELINLCKSKGLTGYSKYKKAELAEFVAEKLGVKRE